MTTYVDVAAPASGRVLSRIQFFVAGAYALAVSVAVMRADSFAGQFYLPSANDQYTANVEIWPGRWYVIWLGVTIVMAFAPLVAVVTSVVAVARLALTRKVMRSLLVSTLCSVAVIAFWLTPAAKTILNWLLD